MAKMNINSLALWFASIGALNWILVALLNYNLVESLLGGVNAGLVTFVYSLVGVSGIWIGFKALQNKVTIRN